MLFLRTTRSRAGLLRLFCHPPFQQSPLFLVDHHSSPMSLHLPIGILDARRMATLKQKSRSNHGRTPMTVGTVNIYLAVAGIQVVNQAAENLQRRSRMIERRS